MAKKKPPIPGLPDDLPISFAQNLEALSGMGGSSWDNVLQEIVTQYNLGYRGEPKSSKILGPEDAIKLYEMGLEPATEKKNSVDALDIMKKNQGKSTLPDGLKRIMRDKQPAQNSGLEERANESYFGITMDGESLVHKKESELATLYKGIVSSDVSSEIIDTMYEAARNRAHGPKYNNRQLFGISTILTLYKNIGSIKHGRSVEEMKGYSGDFDELLYQVMSKGPKKVNEKTKRWKQVEYLNNILSPDAKARFVEGFCDKWPVTRRESPNYSTTYEPEAAGGYRRFVMDHLAKKSGELVAQNYEK